MTRNVVKITAGLVGIVALIVAGIAGYIWFSGGTAQASAPIQAPDLSTGTGTLFRINSADSEVRFIIHEMLLGEPKTVVGTTDQVAGEMRIDFQNPQASQLGAIRINVRTLATDNEFRNKALRGQILQSTQPEYEFATFTPVQLISLPEKVMPGQLVKFQIAGTLNVHGVTRDVTFDAELTLVDLTHVTGTAVATVHYKDFGISIPEAPGVAGIGEEVRLEIAFTAIEDSAVASK